MSKRNLLMLVACAGLLILGLFSCKEEEKTKVEIQLKVEPSELAIAVGKTQHLTVTVSPADTKYTFESANAEIATVDDKGLVTGVATGETTILIKAGDVTKKATVKVIDPSGINADRYLGKDVTGENNKKLIVPIYMMKFSELKDGEALLKKANERYGWVFRDKKTLHEIVQYTFNAPVSDEGKELDGRLVLLITYSVNTAGGGGNSLAFITKTFSGSDLLKEAHDGNEKVRGTIKEIASLYGFDAHQAFGKDEEGALCFTAYNTKQFPEGAYKMVMTSHTVSSRYGLTMEITQEAPKS